MCSSDLIRVAGRAETVEAQRVVRSRTRKGAGSLAKTIIWRCWLCKSSQVRLMLLVVAVDIAADIIVVGCGL